MLRFSWNVGIYWKLPKNWCFLIICWSTMWCSWEDSKNPFVQKNLSNDILVLNGRNIQRQRSSRIWFPKSMKISAKMNWSSQVFTINARIMLSRYLHWILNLLQLFIVKFMRRTLKVILRIVIENQLFISLESWENPWRIEPKKGTN